MLMLGKSQYKYIYNMKISRKGMYVLLVLCSKFFYSVGSFQNLLVDYQPKSIVVEL